MLAADWIATSAALFEVAGVGAMVLGALIAIGRSVLKLRAPRENSYMLLRGGLGRGILLGIEFLVAADIIRSVTTAPTLAGVIVLGLIVVIRTFLSITLSLELEGRWPWQKPR